MSDAQHTDLPENDDVQQEESEGVKSLRAALKKANEELAQFKTAQRESEVKQALSAAGLPAEAAKFAKDADDINAWIEENRGLFGGAGNQQSEPVDDSAPKGGASSLSPEQIEQIQATQVPTQTQFRGGANSELLAKLDKAGSKDEYYRILKEAGHLGRAG